MRTRLTRWAALIVLSSGGVVFISCTSIQMVMDIVGFVFGLVSAIAAPSAQAQ